MERMLRLGILVSGRGTNMQAIIDGCRDGTIPARVAVVISDVASAPALEKAGRAGVEGVFIDRRAFGSKGAFEGAIAAELERRSVDLVCLAGYMRVLGPAFIGRFKGRIINIHPSLLPSFPGVDAQEQAWRYGVKVSGCTVHFVDEGVDSGPVILQAAVPVLDDDTAETLAARILKEEHRIYAEAIRLYAGGRLIVEGRRVRIRRDGGDGRW
ncbi:MAG: phosphoribosylglycinamide formyltransferase [Firmicutes bacterium]|nr:phosphoribosylglycinamide formyltransferase [Bacillota bacterium]